MLLTKIDTSPMANEILYTEQAGVGVIQFNRPRARNALNWSAQEQFVAVVEDVYQNGGPHALIITGKGNKAFASGGDLKELAGVEGKKPGDRAFIDRPIVFGKRSV